MKSCIPYAARIGMSKREHHREPRVDGAGHEVRREDGRVPAGNHRHGEVETDNGVHRNDERRRQAGQQQVGGLVMVPVMRRSAPSHRQRAVDETADARLRPVAQRRQIGYETDEPEQRRDAQVGRDGEHVPDERALEVRPDGHRVRIRHQPVRQPRPAGVHQRKNAGATDGRQRHRFGEPVDRCAPRLLEEQQDGRDQRTGVADADPPDEVRDVERPADRLVIAPDADALDHEVGQRRGEEARRRQSTAAARRTIRLACAWSERPT